MMASNFVMYALDRLIFNKESDMHLFDIEDGLPISKRLNYRSTMPCSVSMQ
jgi:hypothetical protein